MSFSFLYLTRINKCTQNPIFRISAVQDSNMETIEYQWRPYMWCSLLWFVCSWYSTVHYTTVQYNSVQYNLVQYNSVQCNTVQYNTLCHRSFTNPNLTVCKIFCHASSYVSLIPQNIMLFKGASGLLDGCWLSL